VRRLADGKVLCGVAGSAADCFTMIDKFEDMLEEYPNQILRAGMYVYVCM